jgi:hypothetical protein
LGAEFSDSARHRDSVMSLGSIAHLQYILPRLMTLSRWRAESENSAPNARVYPWRRDDVETDDLASPDSVMSLGSIAHLQYYFARTGLLDGKSGRGREWEKNSAPNARVYPWRRDDVETDDLASPEVAEETEREDIIPPPWIYPCIGC